MFASVIDVQLKPGTFDEAMAITRAALPEMREIAGIKQLISIDKGAPWATTARRRPSFFCRNLTSRWVSGRVADPQAAPQFRCDLDGHDQIQRAQTADHPTDPATQGPLTEHRRQQRHRRLTPYGSPGRDQQKNPQHDECVEQQSGEDSRVHG